MTRRLSLILAAALVSSGAAQAQSLDLLSPEIDAVFAKFQAEAHVPGLVYGVVKDGKLSYVKGIGVQDLDAKRPVTPDTLFRIASMTKAFTALSILSLRDEGKLRLDDLAEDYVPEMKGWTYPTSDSPRIRIRDLLAHVGGFVTDDPWGDRQQVLSQEDFTKMLQAGVPFSRTPQMAHEYSNFGYAILGRIIAKASGMPYRTYVERTLLTPLGMTSSGYVVTDAPKDRRAIGYRWENDAWAEEPTMRDGAFNSMGGLQVSANDYAKWVAFLLSAWPPRDGPETGPVKRATVREVAQGLNFISVAQRTGTSGPTACRQALAYGLAWRVAQDCDLGLTLAHGGGYPGYGSHVMLMPDYGVGIFALSNRTYAGPSAPAWDSAVLMHKAGWLKKADAAVSTTLGDFYGLAGQVYAAGNIAALNGRVAMNFPLDRTADNWAKVLADLKAKSGSCVTSAPITATGAMSGTFKWACDKGEVQGQVLLAPTHPITLQALRLSFVATP